MEGLVERLTSWIREQVAAAGCRGAVVGVSGGVDSAVVAVLSKRAFPENVVGVLMPCHSSQRDADDAGTVLRQFGIPAVRVELDEIFDSVLRTVPSAGFHPGGARRAEANLKARLRMVTLYYLANGLDYLVVGTGNRSELSVGYFTKYGDGGVDLLPLGDLVKGEVKELARHLRIPEEIITKPPSGGLWPGQTDEGELGVTYDDLDRYLVSGQADQRVRERVDHLARCSAHKRALPPVPQWNMNGHRIARRSLETPLLGQDDA